jgi:hypothetical protein
MYGRPELRTLQGAAEKVQAQLLQMCAVHLCVLPGAPPKAPMSGFGFLPRTAVVLHSRIFCLDEAVSQLLQIGCFLRTDIS